MALEELDIQEVSVIYKMIHTLSKTHDLGVAFELISKKGLTTKAKILKTV